jgi:mRNA interferase RelE/StbE
MVCYKILWKNSAEHDLKSIPSFYIKKIVLAIESLETNPLPVNSRKLKTTEQHYRIRVGDYRIIYQFVQEPKQLIIIHIRHRKDAYRYL